MMNVLYVLCTRQRFFKALTPVIKYHFSLSPQPSYYTLTTLKANGLFPLRQSVWGTNIRLLHTDKNTHYKNKTTMMYVTAVGLLVVAFSYAAVPMYRIFCQSTSYGGEVKRGHGGEIIENMKKISKRPLTIRFNADTSSSLQWKFRPHQLEIVVLPGETALAFYTATNPTDNPIVGISTYNVIPFEAGQYFNKIQCFCFEEQRLNPREQVDMPVFFYIDPSFVDDPKMEYVNEITLSYTFFEAKEGMKLPVPTFTQLRN